MAVLRCVCCGVALDAGSCVRVRLPDGGDVVCCPRVCAPMRAASATRCRAGDAVRARRVPLPTATSPTSPSAPIDGPSGLRR